MKINHRLARKFPRELDRHRDKILTAATWCAENREDPECEDIVVGLLIRCEEMTYAASVYSDTTEELCSTVAGIVATTTTTATVTTTTTTLPFLACRCFSAADLVDSCTAQRTTTMFGIPFLMVRCPDTDVSLVWDGGGSGITCWSHGSIVVQWGPYPGLYDDLEARWDAVQACEALACERLGVSEDVCDIVPMP